MSTMTITPNWPLAESRLNELINNYLHGGSIGISLFMDWIEPLNIRFFDRKERSRQLYTLIMNAKDFRK
jgi:hypothetical protein